jgi:hypothetical protein
MLVKEVYDIVNRIDEKIDVMVNNIYEKIDKMVLKEDCKDNRQSQNKLIWGLFGFQVLSIIGVIITIIKTN